MKKQETSGRGKAAMRRSVAAPIRLPFQVSLRFGVAALVTILILLPIGTGSLAQKGQTRSGSHTSNTREALSPEAREMVELASAVVCKERIRDPKGSVPIDDMQARPSLPVQSPEALAGAERAQPLLPTAR